ncbi:hypothetical protein DFR87_07960 [Metallosphaera hakonensis JCM 8857 = DSM 7519]|nr:hypothetical protein [Metallosphaera hakonensis]AWR99632.2 hypothetical protein DFR87_07960 [Metallosphaera hakonensis JCM 8857 = DSM 7519]
MEILPFAIILYLNTTLGRGLGDAFNDILQSSYFVELKKEFDAIRKYNLFLGESFMTAIQHRLKIIQGHAISMIYSIAISSQYTGVSISQRSIELLNRLMENMRESFTSYVARSSEIVEVMFSIFLLVPIIVIGFQGLSGGNNTVLLLVPLITSPALYLWISSSQPKLGHHIKISRVQAIALLGSFILLFIPLNILYRIVLEVIAIQIALYPSFSNQINQDKILRDLPKLLREISDYAKIGYSIRTSLERIDLRNVGLEKVTIKVINNIRKKIALGEEMRADDVSNDQIKLVFEILNILDKKGIEGVRVVQELSDLVESIILSRMKIQRELRTFTGLAIITPFLFWFATSSMSAISNFPTTTINLINLGYSLVLSALYSKIYRFSLLNPPLYIVVSIITLLLSFIPPGLIL